MADQDPNEVARQQQMDEAQRRMDARPSVSTLLVEEGTEILQQGKNVMDVITRKAVQLSGNMDERMKQMFPTVDDDDEEVFQKYRMDPSTTVQERVELLRAACQATLPDGTRGIPPHTSVAQTAIDFCVTNRDLLGLSKMGKVLGRRTLRSFSLDEAGRSEALALWKNYLVLENHISAHFRQIILDSEGKAGPNFGNLDVKTYLDGTLYERTAHYIVLKGMVAHWEKKVVDADKVETTMQTKENFVTVTSVGDPRRYLPDPPILFTLKECTQVCYMSQQMTKAFVETPELFDDLPPEIRFIELATSIKGGTAMRKYMKEEFCPQNDISPADLRRAVRRLIQQLDNMQVDPYADIVNTLEKLSAAMAIGTDDEVDVYSDYLLNDPEARFQTYTFNHDERSLVRFFDNSLASLSGEDSTSIASMTAVPVEEEENALGALFNNFGNMGGGRSSSSAAPVPVIQKPPGSSDKYEPPAVRAAGRPHELGWYEELTKDADETFSLDKMPAGRIIREDAGNFDI
mmetsp:Transcript_17134/g.39704  ORF Transcript_17134/g.39704 Transcript_17134/m.39704 type:complete len:517 (-) Transcript_17134:57-1607(-)